MYDLKFVNGLQIKSPPKPQSPRVLYNACPLCDNEHFTEVRTADCIRHPSYHPLLGNSITWLQCDICQHNFTTGYFAADFLQVLFNKIQDGQAAGQDLEASRFTWAKVVEKITKFLKNPAGHVWLDVGFGNGSLLFTAAEYGYKVVGIDVKPANIETIQAFGVEAYSKDFMDYTDFNRFNIISLCDVLEHLPFPGEALSHVKKLLTEDGLLFVSMPNTDTAVWRYWEQNNTNPYWQELEHYHNFSRANLVSLCKRYGFECVHYDISPRYRSCMELIFKRDDTVNKVD